MVVLALCPSRGRPGSAAAILESFEATRSLSSSRLVFIVDSDDPTMGDYPGEVMVVPPTGCMNWAMRDAIRMGVLQDATVVGVVGDDNRFRTPGWDRAIADGLGRIGIGYPSDGWRTDDLPCSWWLSRPIVDALGVAEPTLRHYYTDNYWRALGQATGCYVHFPDVLVEHLHPLAGKASNDAIYNRSKQNASRDTMAYRRWERTRRDHDVAVVRGLLRAGQPRRVLADWHHPALWESLAILFEDRFGWELYAPVGMEWAKRGIWKFEGGTPGWSVRRYLEPKVEPHDGYGLTPTPEYPERPRKVVTWQQAQTIGWDYILDSVVVHQRPFADLARTLGARPVHQVGNARHRIDRSAARGAVILASAANVPGAVTYHQEFSRGLFGPSGAVASTKVTSFMLRLDSTSGDYRWLAESPDIEWLDIGGGSPDGEGYVTPMAKVAELMHATGWVWHDKRIGDGYGHVLWNAASVGRPLIGHASHYRGMMGAPLWRDLETCIDLDRHPPERALRLIRAISADPVWHAAMSADLQATFAQLVDFDAEAEHILRALDR